MIFPYIYTTPIWSSLGLMISPHLAHRQVNHWPQSRPFLRGYHVVGIKWRHNGRGGNSNHQLPDRLLNHLFRHISNEISKLRVTGLCEGNSPLTGDFPTQRASNAENVSIWWRHHGNVFADHTMFFKMTDDRSEIPPWFLLKGYYTKCEGSFYLHGSDS